LPRLSPQLTGTWPPRLVVLSGRTRGVPLPPPKLKIFLSGPLATCGRARRFAPRMTVRLLHTQRSVLQVRDMWTRAPMSGTGSLRALGARQMGFPGARAGEPSLKRGFIPRSAVTLLHFLQLLRPFTSESSTPLLHSQSSAFRRHSRRGLAGSSRALPDREGTQHSAPPAQMECVGARLEDLGRRYSPR
jgi:hypothetical protein